MDHRARPCSSTRSKRAAMTLWNQPNWNEQQIQSLSWQPRTARAPKFWEPTWPIFVAKTGRNKWWRWRWVDHPKSCRWHTEQEPGEIINWQSIWKQRLSSYWTEWCPYKQAKLLSQSSWAEETSWIWQLPADIRSIHARVRYEAIELHGNRVAQKGQIGSA